MPKHSFVFLNPIPVKHMMIHLWLYVSGLYSRNHPQKRKWSKKHKNAANSNLRFNAMAFKVYGEKSSLR